MFLSTCSALPICTKDGSSDDTCSNTFARTNDMYDTAFQPSLFESIGRNFEKPPKSCKMRTTFQKIIFPVIFDKEALILRFAIIKNPNLSHSIEKYQKIGKKFFEIFHPRGLDQNPRKNQLRGELSKIASDGPKVLTTRSYMQNFKSLACLVWAVGLPGLEKWT